MGSGQYRVLLPSPHSLASALDTAVITFIILLMEIITGSGGLWLEPPHLEG